MRVLMVNKFHWPKGGSETYYFSLAEALAAHGHEVRFFSMKSPKNVECADAPYFVTERDYSGGGTVLDKAKAAASLVYSFEARKKFDLLLRDFCPDVIHLNLVHRQITLSILDAPYLRERRIPVVFTAHDYILVCPNYLMLDGHGEVCDDCLSGRYGSCIRKRCVKGSRAKSALAALEARFLRLHRSCDTFDRIIAPSEFMRAKLMEGGFDSERVVHMRNFVGGDVLACAHDATDQTDRGHPYVLFFGRLSPEKGVDIAVRAFLSVAERMPGWRLVIAGDGPEREALEEVTRSSPNGARVEFAGFLDKPDMQRLVTRASLSVACSRWRENRPYSVVESLAMGTPVVGTRIGGIPEVICEGATGWLCEPNDVESLADAMLRGLETWAVEGAYHAMQRCCREYVLEHCDQDRYVESLARLYARLIEEPAL